MSVTDTRCESDDTSGTNGSSDRLAAPLGRVAVRRGLSVTPAGHRVDVRGARSSNVPIRSQQQKRTRFDPWEEKCHLTCETEKAAHELDTTKNFKG